MSINVTNITQRAGLLSAFFTGSMSIFGISSMQERSKYLNKCSSTKSAYQNIQNFSKAFFGTTDFKTRATFLSAAAIFATTYATNSLPLSQNNLAINGNAMPADRVQSLIKIDTFSNSTAHCPSWCFLNDKDSAKNIEPNRFSIDLRASSKKLPQSTYSTNTSTKLLSSDRFCPSIGSRTSSNYSMLNDHTFDGQEQITSILPSQSKVNQPLQAPDVIATNGYVRQVQTAVILTGLALFAKIKGEKIIEDCFNTIAETGLFQELLDGGAFL